MITSESAHWFLVRLDDAGTPGRQPGIRATSNSRFAPGQLDAEGDDLTAAQSFIGLHTAYRRLDPDARYRLEVTHGTQVDEPRVQSIHVGTHEVDPPRRLPAGHLETLTFDLDARPDPDGCLTVSFVGHAPPELAGKVEQVGEPPMVTRVALYADRDPGEVVLDAATVPDGGVVVAVRRVPGLTGVAGARVAVEVAGLGREVVTDEQGDACVLLLEDAASIELGTPIVVRAEVEGHHHQVTIPTDATFHSTWPKLSVPPLEGTDNTRSVSLDGMWRFHPAPPAGAVDPELDDADWASIEVPAQWVQQGFEVAPGTHACYRREFDLDPEPGTRNVLRFDAVYANARVHLNGQHLRTHEGGFTPFEVDITDVLRPGRNVLAVEVRSDSISDVVSAASDYAAHPLGGITRSVHLLTSPTVHLARLHVDTRLVDGGPDAIARVFGQVDGLEDDEVTPVELELRDPSGALVATTSAQVSGRRPRFSEELHLAAPALWTAETPVRHRVIARLGEDGPTAARDIGVREVAVVGQELQVNGHRILLRGVERHEQDPLRGRSTQPELWETDVELMKDANVNNVFTCHYPHPDGFLELCDERGLWVIDESPTVWVTAEVADDPDAFLDLCTPILEMIERDWSRPSIVVWMLGDECAWGLNFWRLVVWLRQQGLRAPMMFSFDIGGPTSLDVASRHYPPPDFAARIEGVEAPVTFDQYCHVNCYNRREAFTDPGVRDWWGIAFEEMWEAMIADPRILGGQIWAWSDDEFHLDRTTMIGYGQWGIVDTWRRHKPEHWHMKQVYTPVKVRTTAIEPGATEVRIKVENRYDFTALDQLTVRWTLGDLDGDATATGSPQAHGHIEVALPRPARAGEVLHVTFLDPDGRDVQQVALPVGERTLVTEPAPAPVEELRVEIQQRAKVFAPNLPEYDAWLVRAGQTSWLLDQEEGLLRSGRLGQRTIVTGGPHLLLLPSTATQHVGPHHRHAIEPFTEVCSGRTIRSVRGEEDADGFTVSTEVAYDEADATIDLHVAHDGTLTVTYRAELHHELDLRQVGVAIDVQPFHDTLAWTRRGQWSVYPDDHVGRLQGRARAAAGPAGRVGLRPDHPWSADTSALGSADFRATRHDVLSFGLHDDTGVGVGIVPVGPTDARAWVHGDGLRLLAASYTSGGSEPILARANHIDAVRRVVRAGEVVAATARFRLGRWSDVTPQ